MALETLFLANDQFRGSLRSTWIASPADEELLVTAIPSNLPTIVVVGWGTDYETIFSVGGASGDSAANYALTGVTRLRGANANIPSGTAVNCLNNEEFFNQYSDAIAEIQAIAEGAAAIQEIVTGEVVTLTDGATPALDASLGQTFFLSAAGNREIQVPTNPTDGQGIRIIHYASGGARTLTLASGAGGFLFGADITELPETASGTYDIIGAIYSETVGRWMVVGLMTGFSTA